MKFSDRKVRKIITVVWIALVVTALSLYLIEKDFLLEEVTKIAGLPILLLSALYLLIGCLRGLTLVPVTVLIIAGLIFLPPWTAYILTLVGIMISSASVYYFSEYLGLADYFKEKHSRSIEMLTAVLKKNELPIVIGWSFFPFVPTDVVVYVCGTLRIDIKKLLLGVFIGEGITCAIYIFVGKDLVLFISKSLLLV